MISPKIEHLWATAILGLGWLIAVAFPATALAASPEPTLSAGEAIDRLLTSTGGSARVSVSRATGVARFVRLDPDFQGFQPPDDAAPAARVAAFLERYGASLGIHDASRELRLEKSTKDGFGFFHLTYRQVHRGVPVFAAVLRAHLDAEHRLVAVNGTVIPDLTLDVTPTWSGAQARSVALGHLRQQMARAEQEHAAGEVELHVQAEQLYVYRTGLARGLPGRNHLAWEIEVVGEGRPVREFVYVDAHTGKIVDQITGIVMDLDREVSQGTLSNVVWDESIGDPDPIPSGWMGGSAAQVTAWNEEIDGAKETYHLFRHLSNGSWLSYDALDATLRTVHLGTNPICPNAWWDGISTNFCAGVTGDDTVAHEWGHAYTDFTGGLIYQWQPGALSESYSDIWGETLDLLNGRQTDSPGGQRTDGTCSDYGAGSPAGDDSYRWLLGEDNPGFGGAIRDMWRPVCFGDPGKTSDNDYWCAESDSGGVHTNSGVPNHLFSLLVDGGTYNGRTVMALGLTKTANLFWRAARVYLVPTTGFADHADALQQSCQDLLGQTLYEVNVDASSPTVSVDVIGSSDCAEVDKAILAVEYPGEVAQCGFAPLLAPDAPALCGQVPEIETLSNTDWESGLSGWVAGTRAVQNPATFDTPDWTTVTALPDGRPGSAAFVANDPDLGDCQTDDETGVLYLESPGVVIPPYVEIPRVALDHWVAVEAGWDGGNLKISVNGGPWSLVTPSAFTFNAYNDVLVRSVAGNTNPLAGQRAFTGADGGRLTGSWGRSLIDLSGLVTAGDSVRLRLEMGLDACFGWLGWYVDDFHVYACAPEFGCPTDIVLSGQTISGSKTYRASDSIEAGPDLVVDGDAVVFVAGGSISFVNGVRIGGNFSAAVGASPCS